MSEIIQKSDSLKKLQDIKQQYVFGNFDQCLHLVNQEFQKHKNFQIMDKTTVEQPDSEEEDNDFWGWNKKFFLPKVPKTTLLVHKCQRQYEQKGVFN